MPLAGHSRRGGSAVEFALTSPVLIGMVLGMLDYGAFFSHEAQVVAGLNGAVLAGAQVRPEDPNVYCDRCVEVATAHARIAVANLGQEAKVEELTPRIERVEGVCALVLETTLKYKPLIDLVPVPKKFDVGAVAMLVYVEDC